MPGRIPMDANQHDETVTDMELRRAVQIQQVVDSLARGQNIKACEAAGISERTCRKDGYVAFTRLQAIFASRTMSLHCSNGSETVTFWSDGRFPADFAFKHCQLAILI